MVGTNRHWLTATNLVEMPVEDVKNWISSLDTILLDCDGVLWMDNEVIKGSDEVVNKFKEIGKNVYFVTNNSTKTRKEFLEKSLRLGFNMKENEIISTAYTAAAYLKKRNFNKKVYVIGSTGITKELDGVGIRHTGTGPDVLHTNLSNFVNEFKPDADVGAVIVGFDEHFSFPKLTKAASYLNNPDCIFIATNTDERFPLPNYVIPGTGSIVKAVETCAERKAIIMGKPNSYICETLPDTIVPERTLMIGDRCNTDILLGKNCRFQTLLVGTGIHSMADVKSWLESGKPEEKDLVPDVYLPRLGCLMDYF